MKTVGVALAGMILAGAVQAHEAGVHVHPHGSEGWMALGVGLVALAGYVAWRQR